MDGANNATAIDICNLALLKLDRVQISQLRNRFKDTGAQLGEENACWRVYEDARKAVLLEYPWSFALKENFLIKLTDLEIQYQQSQSGKIDPDDPQYISEEKFEAFSKYSFLRTFQLPGDFLSLHAVKLDNNLPEGLGYSFRNGQIYTNSNLVYILYIYDNMNVTSFPSDFKLLLAIKIAFLISRRFLESLGMEQTLNAEYQMELNKMKVMQSNKVVWADSSSTMAEDISSINLRARRIGGAFSGYSWPDESNWDTKINPIAQDPRNRIRR